jgi:PilZ domain
MSSDKMKHAGKTSEKHGLSEKDPESLFKHYIEGSGTDEDILFEINELLHSGKYESTRKNVRAPLAIKVVFKTNGEEFTGESYTLSNRGIFIKHPSPPPVSTPVEVTFTIPSHKTPINVSGKVVQSTAIDEATKKRSLAGMSIVFDSIDPKSANNIDEMVKKKIKGIKRPS